MQEDLGPDQPFVTGQTSSPIPPAHIATLLLQAASSGFFPKQDFFQRHDLGQAIITWIDFSLFEQRPYCIRLAEDQDLLALLVLEAACWSAPLQASTDEIRQRLQTYPQGQCVLCLEGEVVAVVYSQRISSLAALEGHTFRTVSSVHTARGPIVQLLAINVLPAQQHLGLGDQLLDFMLRYSALHPGVEQILAVSLCQNYSAQSLLSLSSYIHRRQPQGYLQDPILRFHESHGARIIDLVPGYRPEDTDNQGCGVLVRYDPASLLRPSIQPSPLASGFTAAEIAEIVTQSIQKVVNATHPLPLQRPLRELGLQSTELLELRLLLEKQLHLLLEPVIFFRHSTPAALIHYAQDHLLRNSPHSDPLPQTQSEEEVPAIPVATEDSKIQGLESAIAIIGMACRFPGGADDPEAFWNRLVSGQEGITERPPQRYSFAPDQVHTPQYGGFLEHVDQFDAEFFHISPREASVMDPQQRLLLEESWHALEHAGLDPRALVGSQTGVFVGIFTHDYELLQVKQQTSAGMDAYFGTGTSVSVAAGRLAYVLGLQGPALAVDTACSSSLTALHLACRSLQAGDCQLALVAAVNLILSDELNHTFAQAGMLAPDGRCKTFDASANGYVRSEGCGVVVLKPLLAAMQAGDQILGVIRGSALNQDGASNGLTAPSGLAQEQVIRQALAASDLPPAAIDYVEAHGTGTALGDPVEIQALQRVYGENRPSAQPLVVGSVKTNVGHTEAAAGMAGLIKVLLALQHEFIPPHLHFQTLNPHIQLTDFPLQIPSQGRGWQRQVGRKRRAGISAFGFSGTNAHVIIEEAPEGPIPVQTPQPGQLLPLSAPTAAVLQDRVQQYVKVLQDHPETDLADLCYTSQVGRSHWSQRLAVVGHSPADLREQLQQVLTRHPDKQVLQGTGGSTLAQIAFLFTGQGSQYEQMGRQLYEIHPVFRRTLEQCQAILEPLGIPLLQILYPQRQGLPSIHATAYTQPVLFALEYSLAQLWRSWGIEPAAVMGHSVGEYVAACVAGVFSLEAGLQLITARGRLMQALPSTGGMAAILASPTEILQVLATYPPEEISLAAMNGPQHGVISGHKDLVEQVSARFASQGIRVVPLQVSHAFHSPLMEPMLKAFATEAEQVQFAIPQIPLISNLTGEKVGIEITEANYWVEHIRQPVRFAEGMASLQAAGCSVFVECGPRPILLGMGRQSIPQASCHWIPSLHPEQPDWQHLLQSVGELYTTGIDIRWENLTGIRHRKIPLPTYPFQRQSYWLSPPPQAFTPQNPPDLTHLLEHLPALTEKDLQVLSSVATSILARKQPEVHPLSPSAVPPSWFFEISWQPIPREDSGLQVPLPPGQWILFADQGGIGQQLKHKLQSQGQHCTLVFPGKQRQQQSEASWQIRPDQAQDIHHVLQAAQQSCLPLHGLVYLWGLDLQNLPLTPTVLAEQQKFLWGSVLAILRSLEMDRGDHLTKLWLVTRDSVEAGAGSLQGLGQTCLWGLGKTLGLEHPERFGGLLDLGPEPAAANLDLLATDLLQPQAEQQMAYRQGQRYGARLQQGVQLPHRQITFSPHRTYLITGGLGHLGLQVAGWLVRQGVRHLILISRRSPASQPRFLLDQWRQSGVQITTLSADIASAANLSAVLTQVQRTLPPLGGIFHAAGVINTVPLQDMTGSDVLEVIRPKILGAWNLHHLTLGQDLECFVCFSSIASVWGSRGQAHYAAANHFLDGLAHYRRHQGLPGLTINWGPWAEGGMADPEFLQWLHHSGIDPLPSPLAVQALGDLLASGHPQAVVANLRWKALKPQLQTRSCPTFFNQIPEDQEISALVSPPLSPASPQPQGAQLFYAAAATPAELKHVAIQKILHSQPHQNHEPAEVMHPCRLAMVVESRKEALEILADFLADQAHPHLYTGSIGSPPAAIAFLFSGHTTQYWGMGKELFQINAVFRQVLEDCDREARNHLQDQSLLDYFFTSPATAFDLDTTSITLPALFALQCGLVEVWKSWGIQPAFVLGSSVGELAAACTAGCISRADGIRYTVAIGQLLETLPRDCQMLGITGMTEAEVENLISPLVPDISVVAQAGWRNTIVGPPHLLQQILPLIEQAGAGTVDLQSSYGVHTHRIDSLAKDLEKLIKGIQFHKPQIPFISTVTGEIAQGEVPPIHYSKEMAQQPVRLSAAIRTCLQHQCQTFLEIGPSIVTLSMGMSSVEAETGHWIPSLRQQQSDWTQMLLSLSQLYVLGSSVNWDQVETDQRQASGRLGLGCQPADPQMTVHQQVLLSLTNGGRVEAEKILLTFLQSRIARILHLKSSLPLDAEATLPHLGIDSIMSTELRHQVKAELGIDLPFGLLMKGPTLGQLAAFILEATASIAGV